MNFLEAVQINRRAVLNLSDPEIRTIMPVLYDIREDTARAFFRFLKTNDIKSDYNRLKHRALLAQLDDVIKTAERKLPAATAKELKTETTKASKISMKNLQQMITAGEVQFRDAVSPLKLNIAKIMQKQGRMRIERHATSAQRYGLEVSKQIRNDLTIGVVKGETIEQMARRLSDGGYDRVAAKGKAYVAEKMADGQFFANEADAVRLVRTELNAAYNDDQIEGIKQADDDDPGWKKKWDAANDDNVCDDCDELDGEVVDPDEDFTGGVSGPPLHPNDRCSVVPWRDDWKGSL